MNKCVFRTYSRAKNMIFFYVTEERDYKTIIIAVSVSCGLAIIILIVIIIVITVRSKRQKKENKYVFNCRN